MAKASLTKVSKEWIDGKNEKIKGVKKSERQNLKKQKNKNVKKEINKILVKRSVRTIHLADEAYRLLMYNKGDTGEPISHAIERLVLNHFKK